MSSSHVLEVWSYILTLAWPVIIHHQYSKCQLIISSSPQDDLQYYLSYFTTFGCSVITHFKLKFTFVKQKPLNFQFVFWKNNWCEEQTKTNIININIKVYVKVKGKKIFEEKNKTIFWQYFIHKYLINYVLCQNT